TGLVLSMSQSLESAVHTFTTGLEAILTPRVHNEFRANYSNQRIATRFDMDNFGGAVPVPDSVLFPAGYTSVASVVSFNIVGVGQFNQGRSSLDEQRQVNAIDNLSIVTRGHQMKFGVDYRWLGPFQSPYAYRQFVQFTGFTSAAGGVFSSIPSTGAV